MNHFSGIKVRESVFSYVFLCKHKVSVEFVLSMVWTPEFVMFIAAV